MRSFLTTFPTLFFLAGLAAALVGLLGFVPDPISTTAALLCIGAGEGLIAWRDNSLPEAWLSGLFSGAALFAA